jgi:hypothetical protein
VLAASWDGPDAVMPASLLALCRAAGRSESTGSLRASSRLMDKARYGLRSAGKNTLFVCLYAVLEVLTM